MPNHRADTKTRRKRSKTYGGCWSCRERSVKCDELRPSCGNCLKTFIPCKGYDIRLSWDIKKADNLRRFKVYDHLAHWSFARLTDLDLLIAQLDQAVEERNCRNLVTLPITVFESNGLVTYWAHNVADKFNITWLKQSLLGNLQDTNVVNSIFSSAWYIQGNSRRGEIYASHVWKEYSSEVPTNETTCWILSILNILLTSNIADVSLPFDYKTAMERIESLLELSSPNCKPHLTSIVDFMNSFRFVVPKSSDIVLDLSEIGITKKLLANWYQILSMSSNTDIPFFKLEDELWFNKRRLLLSTTDPQYHRSYIWYIAIYICFIKKFYHQRHGRVSIDYLIREATPHLQHIESFAKLLGTRWCLFIIANESANQTCNELISTLVTQFHIPMAHGDKNWPQYIETSTALMI